MHRDVSSISVSIFCCPEVRACSFIHVGFYILCRKHWLSLEGGQFCFINLITFSRSVSPCTTSRLELIDMDSNSCLAVFNQSDWGRDQVVWKHLPTCQGRRKYCPRSNVWKIKYQKVCKVSTTWMDGRILTLYLSTDYAQIFPLWEKYVLDKLDVFERHQRFIFSW